MNHQPVEQIYSKPDAYDLEHAQQEPDIDFFIRLARRIRPKSLLEIACGNGRVTIPLARAAEEWGGKVSGVELGKEMLQAAKCKHGAECVTWFQGDMREWQAPEPFDLIVSPCGSLSHLLSLDDQLSTWRTAYGNLHPGGQFVVAESMANLPVLAESMHVPPRASMEIDLDTEAEDGSKRLLRYRTTRYRADRQQAKVQFLYDQFNGSKEPERFASNYESHVYFPNEVQLLFVATGFRVEALWGNYRGEALCHTSRQLIVAGSR